MITLHKIGFTIVGKGLCRNPAVAMGSGAMLGAYCRFEADGLLLAMANRRLDDRHGWKAATRRQLTRIVFSLLQQAISASITAKLWKQSDNLFLRSVLGRKRHFRSSILTLRQCLGGHVKMQLGVPSIFLCLVEAVG